MQIIRRNSRTQPKENDMYYVYIDDRNIEIMYVHLCMATWTFDKMTMYTYCFLVRLVKSAATKTN